MALELDARKWSRQQFSGAKLGDKRRLRRLVQLGRMMALKPGAPLPELGRTPYDVKAIYNLLGHVEATPENLQAGHRRRVQRFMRQPGQTILLAEDTSEFAWVTYKELPGLGPVGDDHPRAKGFMLHSVLAMRWTAPLHPGGPYRHPSVELLGLPDQLYYVRKPVPTGECDDSHARQRRRDRESQLWANCTKHLGPAPKDTRWVRVCDRGADIYELLISCQEFGHGFVVRAAQDRILTEPKGHLFGFVRSLEGWTTFEMKVRERPKRPAHIAKLAIVACQVSIQSPARPGAPRGKLPPVRCHAVRVWEPEPPTGSEPLEWILLTDHPTENTTQALEVALQYATRWVIEDFHKALKTGLGADRLHLDDAKSLFAAISVMSVDALRLLDLRERLRAKQDEPATESGFDPLELQLLHHQTRRVLKTVNDVALALGRLGGHMNRKADGLPGLITLWRGYNELKTLTAGARLARQLSGFG